MALDNSAKKSSYPKAIFFIIGNEFCERFNYYGMRTVLVLYLNRNLGYTDDDSTIIFHIFAMLNYSLCVFGAIIADSWLGKFKTILYISMIYIAGSTITAVGAIPPLHLPARIFTMVGLVLIAIGSGGIKPCVSTFGGDQFNLPEQMKQMTTYFSLFYFSINMGSLISTMVTPILREDVHCFAEMECYSLAFGVPAALMVISLLIFIFGRPLYKMIPPEGNIIVLVFKAIFNAIKTKIRESKTNPREHWLDYADKNYDKQLLSDIKAFGRMLILLLPMPLFWALFDQQGSRWTFQATRMDGTVGSWNIKPDQMQLLNPLFILVFIPLYQTVFYPALRLVHLRRPLQRLTLGGILAGVAFIMSAVLELQLEKTYPELPKPTNAQLRVFNGESCDYSFKTNIPGYETFSVPYSGYIEYKNIPVPDEKIDFTYEITAAGDACEKFKGGSNTLRGGTAHSLFLSSKNPSEKETWYEDYVDKPSKGLPLVRMLTNVQPGRIVTWKTSRTDTAEHAEKAYEHSLTEFKTNKYKVLIDDTEVTETQLKNGGVYTVIINENPSNQYEATVIEVIEPNSIHMLWQIPQYFTMTLAEVMFSVTGLSFSYSEAPISMKSVVSACWLLSIAVGNVIVVIIAELNVLKSQAHEFFLFAGLMFVDMLIFSILAYYYKPNNPDTAREDTMRADEDRRNKAL